MAIVFRIVVNAVALWVAIRLVPGVSFTGDVWRLLGVALVFAVLNASVRPVLMFLTLPFFILTLGLFTFVLNAFMLWITAALSSLLDLGLTIEGFGAAFLGALVVSTISFVLSVALWQPIEDKRRP